MDEPEPVVAKVFDTIIMWQLRHWSALSRDRHVMLSISLSFCSKRILDLLRAAWVALLLILVEDGEEVIIRDQVARIRIENERLYFRKRYSIVDLVIIIDKL